MKRASACWKRVLCLALDFAAAVALLAHAGCARRPIERVEWTTMGTVAAVQVRGGGAAAVRSVVQAAFEDVRREFDAHDPESAIRRLGGCTDFGRPCHDCALRLKEASGGAFDPYWRRDGRLDYGAIAKGFAVDVAAARLASAIPEGQDVLIDLGGNVKAVRGDWRVGVRGTSGDGVCETVDLKEGESLATSALYFRGRHICDARTGEPVDNDVASVTVRCDSAMEADGLSTALFVLGVDAGRELLVRFAPGASAFFVLADGSSVWVR